MRTHLFTCVLFALLVQPASAVLPDEQLSDPKLEARARHISQELRCVVCQNQTIDDSDAPLAHDLRVLLRERLVKGDSDDAAKDFLVKRYGTYVLLRPPFQQDTLALWLGPLGVLLIGAAASWVYFRGRSSAVDQSASVLNDEEQREVSRLVGGDKP
jgi:cytochrome c-type biogenesis protein CcmH